MVLRGFTRFRRVVSHSKGGFSHSPLRNQCETTCGFAMVSRSFTHDVNGFRIGFARIIVVSHDFQHIFSKKRSFSLAIGMPMNLYFLNIA